MINKIKTTEDRMKKSIEALRKQFMTIRTGKANASILEGVKLEYYGALTPINQVAGINIPEARLIEIRPWDQSIIGEIEKAIVKSGLGLTPVNDGKVVRINIPPLTEERRKELIKFVGKIAEESKISIRNIRREMNDVIENSKKAKEIGEDEARKYRERVQNITDKYIVEVDKIVKNKEQEIMEV